MSSTPPVVPSASLKQTPFHSFHVSAGAKMVDFAGWEMPLLYRGIVDEHVQTRTSGSLFDVSHMGRLNFSGKEATAFLNKVLTRNVAEQRVGQSRYSLVCNESGGILDDIIISKDSKNWMMVCNASNRAKLVSHFNQQRSSFDVEITDTTQSTAMVAIQGPRVIDRMAEILPVDVKAMKRYSFETSSFMLIKFTVFRSGYTGEDGIELVLPAKMAGMAIKMAAGNDHPGATIRPAGLGWAVDLKKEFIGAGSLRDIVASGGPRRKLVGLELEGKRIARQGSPVLVDGRSVGVITSGTLSPTLGKSIAMAYVDAEGAAVGTSVSVDLKGTANAARIVPLPFYKRAEKNPGLPGI
jgi:aminomethyltransferase